MFDNEGEVYIVEPIQDVRFTKEELLDMGIIFFDNPNELMFELTEFGVLDFDEESQLIDFDLTLSQVGPISSPTWALHNFDLMQEYVCDVWNKVNFYSISVREEEEDLLLVDRAYLRDETLEDDLMYYIEDRLIMLEQIENNNLHLLH